MRAINVYYYYYYYQIVRRDVNHCFRDLMLNVTFLAGSHTENGLPRIITKSHTVLQTFLWLAILIIVLRSVEVPKLILYKTYKISLDINRKLVGYWAP